jgi:DNA-nicking Smr family endonuclease
MKRKPPILDKPYRKHRVLSQDEQAIWQAEMGEQVKELPLELKKRPSAAISRKITPVIEGKKLTPAKPKKETLPLQTVDIRTRSKIKRGLISVDATLDLHGFTKATAHTALVKFITDAQTRGASLVLIITGKGREGKPGILREELPRWLNESPLRQAIIAYDVAGPHHGAEGAWYVRIRKKRSVER